MEWLANVFFQIFSLMAIILPVIGSIFFLWCVWRLTKALENIQQELKLVRQTMETWKLQSMVSEKSSEVQE